jgi:hypothetical protein
MGVMPGSVHAMLSGMLIMVLPAFLVCVGIAIMAYRRRDKFARKVNGRPVRARRP